MSQAKVCECTVSGLRSEWMDEWYYMYTMVGIRVVLGLFQAFDVS